MRGFRGTRRGDSKGDFEKDLERGFQDQVQFTAQILFFRA